MRQAPEDEVRVRQRIAREVAAEELKVRAAVLFAVRGDQLRDDLDAGVDMALIDVAHPVQVAARRVDDAPDRKALDQFQERVAKVRAALARGTAARARFPAPSLVVRVDAGEDLTMDRREGTNAQAEPPEDRVGALTKAARSHPPILNKPSEFDWSSTTIPGHGPDHHRGNIANVGPTCETLRRAWTDCV